MNVDLVCPKFNKNSNTIMFTPIASIPENDVKNFQLEIEKFNNSEGILVYDLLDKLPSSKDRFIMVNNKQISYYEFKQGINNEGFTSLLLSWFNRDEAYDLYKNLISLPVLNCMLYLADNLNILVDDVSSAANLNLAEVYNKLSKINKVDFIELIRNGKGIIISEELYNEKLIREVMDGTRDLFSFDDDDNIDIAREMIRSYMGFLYTYNFKVGRKRIDNASIHWSNIKQFLKSIGIEAEGSNEIIHKKKVTFPDSSECKINPKINSILNSFLLQNCENNKYYLSTLFPITNFLIKFIILSEFKDDSDVVLPKIDYTKLLAKSYDVYESKTVPIYTSKDESLEESERLQYRGDGIQIMLKELDELEKSMLIISLCRSICSGCLFDLFIFCNKCINYSAVEIEPSDKFMYYSDLKNKDNVYYFVFTNNSLIKEKTLL